MVYFFVCVQGMSKKQNSRRHKRTPYFYGFDEATKNRSDAPFAFLATNDARVMRRGFRIDIARAAIPGDYGSGELSVRVTDPSGNTTDLGRAPTKSSRCLPARRGLATHLVPGFISLR